MSSLEKRFGAEAVKTGMISIEQLQEGLKLQVKENVERKRHRLIGIILQDLGYMDGNQVAELLLTMINE